MCIRDSPYASLMVPLWFPYGSLWFLMVPYGSLWIIMVHTHTQSISSAGLCLQAPITLRTLCAQKHFGNKDTAKYNQNEADIASSCIYIMRMLFPHHEADNASLRLHIMRPKMPHQNKDRASICSNTTENAACAYSAEPLHNG